MGRHISLPARPIPSRHQKRHHVALTGYILLIEARRAVLLTFPALEQNLIRTDVEMLPI